MIAVVLGVVALLLCGRMLVRIAAYRIRRRRYWRRHIRTAYRRPRISR